MNDVELPPPLIVCERTGRWAVALRAAFVRRNLAAAPIVETRSPTEWQATVMERRRRGLPAGPVIVELTAADAERACSTTAWHVRHGDDVPLAIVTTDGGDYEAAARAAGATSFVASLGAVDEIVETYFAFVADAANRCVTSHEDERSTAERLWDALPWSTT